MDLPAFLLCCGIRQDFLHLVPGEIAKTIFALGIIGTGLLAIPVMAGSSAYALSDTFGWKQGLNKTFKQAKAFYFVIAAVYSNWTLDKFLKYRPNQSISIHSSNQWSCCCSNPYRDYENSQ